MINQLEPIQIQKKLKGVCRITRVPPGMSITKLKELLQPYGIDRVYLIPHKDNNINHTQKQQKKRRSYVEGWVEFLDRRVAKMTALSLNGTPISIFIKSLNNMYLNLISKCTKKDHNLVMINDFTWEDLNEKFQFDQKTHQDKVKLEMIQAKKVHEFYQEKVEELRIRKQIKISNQQNKQ